MIKRILCSMAVAAIGISSMIAMPALPKLMKMTQPDGSTVEVFLRGDESYHFFETPAGEIALRDAEGYITYAELDAKGRLCPGSVKVNFAAPASALHKSDLALKESLAKAPQRIAPGEIKTTFPTTGTVRGLIILAEYQDVKMSALSTAEHYQNMLNGENYSDDKFMGSVRDYFVAQSNGKFTPEFDIVGPVTLPQNRSYYGLTENYVDQMRDACMIADKEFGVDFTRYDANNDGFVDFVFIIYAGHGEAQGGPAESVWPAMMDFSSKIYDYFDGMNLSVGACSCELAGKPTDEEALDGMGTICHEFSHILGLPDIYDPTYSGGYGMGHFDLLDCGGYNGGSFVPSSFTAMDKYNVGWLEPRVLETSAKDVTLAPAATTGEAYFIVNPDNNNEYFILENRQWTGWDSELPGHGLVISRVTYNPTLWARNTVNSPGRSGLYEHVLIMPADNTWEQNITGTPRGNGSEAGDPWPGVKNNTVFSSTTKPAVQWMSTANKDANFTISNISEDANGTVHFDFESSLTGVDSVEADSILSYDRASATLTAGAEVTIFALNGNKMATLAEGIHSLNNLPAGIYVAVAGDISLKIIR